ncbi:MAG: hypothetical protein ACFCU9_10500 [Cyanophyceae cyanobacterium]
MSEQVRRLSQRLRLFLPWLGILLALTGILLLKSCGSSQPTIPSTEPSPAVVVEDARRGWLPIRPGSPLQSLTQILNAAEIDGIPLTVGQSITLKGSSPAIEWRDSTGRVLGRGFQLVYQAQDVRMETITARIGQAAQSRVSFTVSSPDVVVAPHVKVIPDDIAALEDNGILTLPIDERIPTLLVGDVVVGARVAPQQITALQTQTGLLSLSTVPALPKQVIEQAAVRFEGVPLQLSLETDPIPLVEIPSVGQTILPRPRWEAFQSAGDPTPVGIESNVSQSLNWQGTLSGSLRFDDTVGNGLRELVLTQQAQIQTELELKATGFYRWQQDPQDQMVIPPQVRILAVNVGPVPLPIELSFSGNLAYEANLWLNGQAGIQVGLASAVLSESVVYTPSQSQPWQRQGQVQAAEWQGSVSPETNVSGLLNVLVSPQMEVGIFGSRHSGGLGISGVLVGGSSGIEITDDSSSPGQLQGQVSGESRSVLVGQLGYVGSTEVSAEGADVARLADPPLDVQITTAVLITITGIKVLIAAPALLIPAAILTIGVGAFIALNEASQPDLSGLRLGDPVPQVLNVDAQRVIQTIDDLTGGEEDEDPQTDPGDNGGQCTPPPGPPPTCDPSNPLYPPNQTQQEILEGIQRDLLSSQRGIRFQAEVAQQLLESGIELISYGRKVPPGTGSITDIDIETREAIIEVTISENGKLPSIRTKITNCDVNPEGKPVALFAPSYTPRAEVDIVNIGGLVVRTIGDLVGLVR